MTNTFTEKMKKLDYLENSSVNLKKLYLRAFDAIDDIAKEVHDCIAVIAEIRRLVVDEKITVENLRPIVSELGLLQNKISDLIPDMTEINNLYRIFWDKYVTQF